MIAAASLSKARCMFSLLSKRMRSFLKSVLGRRLFECVLTGPKNSHLDAVACHSLRDSGHYWEFECVIPDKAGSSRLLW